ncbi:MAG TPA: Ldh family oxidoreductase [Candidatus Saccharimonadales bacterium]
MKIPISELRQKVADHFISAGLDDADAKTMTELIVEQEMVGNRFSAVGELNGKHARLIEGMELAKEEVAMDKAATKLIKGNGRLAPLITADYLPEVIANAKTQGIYALGIYDSTYNDFFNVFSRRIAAEDCIGIVVENGGPGGVVPFGGKKDITGTNPIAFGIPTNKSPIVFDAATSMHAYGAISQAKARGKKLPDNAYVDKEGNITTDPNVAYAVLPFGGFKGYAINLLIEVLTTSLVRSKAGLDQPTENQRHIGTFIIVIDPAAFGDITEFKNSTTKLAEDILAVPPVNPNEPVRIPGFKGSDRRERFIQAGEVEIADEDWQKFTALLK